MLLVVESADNEKWARDESDFIVRAIQLARNHSTIAPERIAIGGRDTGGAMAAFTVF